MRIQSAGGSTTAQHVIVGYGPTANRTASPRLLVIVSRIAKKVRFYSIHTSKIYSNGFVRFDSTVIGQ